MKKQLLTTAIITSVIMAASSANAINQTFQSSVQVVDTLKILAGGTDLSFGKIQKPTVISHVAMTKDGAVTKLDGDTEVLGGATAGASYTISGDGDAGSLINISITDAGGEAGFVLSNFTATYGTATFTDSSTGLSAPGVGKILAFGAKLEIPANPTAGVKHPAYNIAVNYQ